MPILFIVVASVVLFLAVLALMAVAAFSEGGQLHRIRFDPSARPFPLAFGEAYDVRDAVLWRTQAAALQRLELAGPGGMEYRRLFREYQREAANFPEIYEGSSFAQWLLFLQRSGLVGLGSRRVSITPHGREFLHYCLEVSSAA